jgi:hypothetical protein
MEPGNAHELANAIRQLLPQPAERQRLGEQARRSALELFDQNTVLQRLQTRLTTIIDTQPEPCTYCLQPLKILTTPNPGAEHPFICSRHWNKISKK